MPKIDRQISKWDRLAIFAIPFIGRLILSLLFRSCKIDILNFHLHKRFILGDKQVIGATWHRGAIFMVYFFKDVHPMIMFSKSKDGEFLARFAKSIGIIPVRGSTGKGGRDALRSMIQHLNTGNKACATVPDGPQGPRCRVQKGLLILSRETGVPILPIMWSADRLFTFHKTWDKTILPKPFSNIKVIYGEPVSVPPGCKGKALNEKRLLLERRLNEIMITVDNICGYSLYPPPEY